MKIILNFHSTTYQINKAQQGLKIFLCTLFCLAIFTQKSFSAIPSDIESKLKTAEKLYKEKKYSEVIQLYQEVLNNGYQSFEIYYNLGNAYFKNNQLGKAILYYEKAKLLQPSDDDLQHNLKIAYNQTIDKIETKDNFFIEVTKNNFLNRINPDAMAYGSIIFSFLALLTFVVFLFNQNYRKVMMILSVVFFLSSIIFYFIGKLSLSSKNDSQFAVVTVKETKVVNEPHNNAISKFSLHEGTKVKILQKVDNFVLIRLSNGVEGWIDEKSIEVI